MPVLCACKESLQEGERYTLLFKQLCSHSGINSTRHCYSNPCTFQHVKRTSSSIELSCTRLVRYCTVRKSLIIILRVHVRLYELINYYEYVPLFKKKKVYPVRLCGWVTKYIGPPHVVGRSALHATRTNSWVTTHKLKNKTK